MREGPEERHPEDLPTLRQPQIRDLPDHPRRTSNPYRHHKLSARTANTADWRALRLEIIRRDNWRCESCGTHYDLTVYLHPCLEGDHSRATPGLCVTLCRSCHGSVEHALEPAAGARSLTGASDTC